MVFPAASSPTSTSAAHPRKWQPTSAGVQMALSRRSSLQWNSQRGGAPRCDGWSRRRGVCGVFQEAWRGFSPRGNFSLDLAFPVSTGAQPPGSCRTVRFRLEQVEDPATVPEAQAAHPRPCTSLDVLPLGSRISRNSLARPSAPPPPTAAPPATSGRIQCTAGRAAAGWALRSRAPLHPLHKAGCAFFAKNVQN